MIKLILNAKDKLKNMFFKFVNEEDGMGVVEIILITIVLVSIVIIFKKQITGVVNDILSKMTNQANQV